MHLSAKQKENMRTFKDRKWVQRALAIVIFIIMGMFLNTCVPMSLAFAKQHDWLFSGLIFSVGVVLSIGFLALLRILWRYIPYNDKEDNNVSAREGWLWFAVAVVIYFIVQVIISLTTTHSFEPPKYPINIFVIIMLWWFLGIVAPIFEEVIMRGFFLTIFFKNPHMYNYISEKISPRLIQMITGVVVSALITTYLHYNSGSLMANIGFFINGVLAAILFYRTKRIRYSILLHMINNHIVVVILILYHLGWVSA